MSDILTQALDELDDAFNFFTGDGDSVTDSLVAAWLDGPGGVPALDKLVHWGAIGTADTISSVNTLNSYNLNKNVPAFGKTAAVAEVINAIYATLADPNIEGIPIKASSQVCTRDINVTENMVIAQNDNSKEWVTDNAAPKCRQWQISGYLMSMSATVDGYMLVKPTLQLQIELLDAYARSRRPVWFKSHYATFNRVLIEHFSYSFEPTTQNGVKVDLKLREYKPYVASRYATVRALVDKVSGLFG